MFEPNTGDTIICIEECKMYNEGKTTITIGKEYKVYSIYSNSLFNKYIIDDDNDYHWFTDNWHKYFLDKKKYRKLKLNKIENEQGRL